MVRGDWLGGKQAAARLLMGSRFATSGAMYAGEPPVMAFVSLPRAETGEAGGEEGERQGVTK